MSGIWPRINHLDRTSNSGFTGVPRWGSKCQRLCFSLFHAVLNKGSNSDWVPAVPRFLCWVGWCVPENSPLLKPLHWWLFSSISMVFSFSRVEPSLVTLPATQMSRVGPSGAQSRIWPYHFVASLSVSKFCLLYFNLREVVASDILRQSLCNISEIKHPVSFVSLVYLYYHPPRSYKLHIPSENKQEWQQSLNRTAEANHALMDFLLGFIIAWS